MKSIFSALVIGLLCIASPAIAQEDTTYTQKLEQEIKELKIDGWTYVVVSVLNHGSAVFLGTWKHHTKRDRIITSSIFNGIGLISDVKAIDKFIKVRKKKKILEKINNEDL